VRQSKTPVNAVLAGYFSKVLTLLLSRKQNQLIPYLFDTNNDAIDCMLNHMYQKSVSEVLLSILKIEEGNFTDELANTIKKRKISVISKLVNKLGSDTDDEECLNATFILNELIDVNCYFNIINHQPTIERLS
jgi:serine/threonine-protein phosphatase 6 regulatory subunit 3